MFFPAPHTFESHPYLPLIPECAKCLIVGTIPPHRFCKDMQTAQQYGKLSQNDVDWYYGSEDNQF